jgi:hypothetical protein
VALISSSPSGQVILGIRLESTDREIEISRSERDQETGVLLFLCRDCLGEEAGDLRQEHDRCRAGFVGYRYVVDDEFIEWLLGDLSSACQTAKKCCRYRD